MTQLLTISLAPRAPRRLWLSLSPLSSSPMLLLLKARDTQKQTQHKN